MSTVKHAARRNGKKHLLPGSSPGEASYLESVGQRVRALRSLRNMTRRVLAVRSGVSERFLAEVESGTGNASLLILRQLAGALDVSVESLVLEDQGTSAELFRTSEFLRTLSPPELAEAERWLGEHFRPEVSRDRRWRVALLGLRGAGKSTIGTLLARKLQYPFLELDRLIEKASGSSLSSIFDLYGQSGFRRMEGRAFDDVLATHKHFVLATGGSIVSDSQTFQRLLNSCYTVWLKADPEDHMQRVIEQGDTRPLADHPEAMSDLKRILREREHLYAKADLIVNTSEQPLQTALARIASRLS